MTMSYSTGTVHALLNQLKTTFTNGVIEIYSGTRPANADAAPTGTLLGTVTLNGGGPFVPGTATYGTNFANAANRAIDKATAEVWQFTASASGQATWFRHKTNAEATIGIASTTLARMDGSLATFGGDGTLSDTNIVAGNVYTFNHANFTWPGI